MAGTRGAIAAAVLTVMAGLVIAVPAGAQKSGGILRSYSSVNPPSASIHEEATIATFMGFSGVFNNLLIFDQTQPRHGLDTVQPELAESWVWDATRTRLTVKLRQGVRWHDGRPFTARDVQCTWAKLKGTHPDPLRVNPRGAWWSNLKEVTTEGDLEATFILARPQASFPALLASSLSPVYPCHVPTKDIRRRPIGTGPFKLASFDANQSVKLVRNTDYWKPGRPYLDGVEMKVIPNRSTRVLAFIAKEFDLTLAADLALPLVTDVEARAPTATCKYYPTGASVSLLVNRERPPFNEVLLRKVMALALDRQGIIDIVTGGKARITGAMLSEPEGRWAMPREMVLALPNYGGTLAERRAEARKIMEGLGYGPGKRLKVKLTTRDFQSYKDPAVLVVDQLNQVHFDTELEILETAIWYGRATRQDYAVAITVSSSGVDDPDVTLAEGYACKSDRNYTKYCNPQVEALIEKQSQETDVGRRKQIVWQIERILAEDVARPIIMHNRGGTCWYPHVKGLVPQENAFHNTWRFEGVWLDR